MASDQGNPSAFSCAMGGKKREGNTRGGQLIFSVKKSGFVQGTEGKQYWAWLSPSPVLPAIEEHWGLVTFRAVQLHGPSSARSSILWRTQEGLGLSVQSCSGKAHGNQVWGSAWRQGCVGSSHEHCVKDHRLVICQVLLWPTTTECHKHYRGRSKTAQGELQAIKGVRNRVLGAPCTDG